MGSRLENLPQLNDSWYTERSCLKNKDFMKIIRVATQLLLFILINLLISVSLAKGKNASHDSRYDKFDILVSQYYDAGLFTGVVLISDHGEVIFLKSYGLANREHNVANMPSTKFRLGSITKQFTATAIMILQQEGLLSVHDPIRKFLTDYPESGEKITIHHLLTHTSGIPEYFVLPEFEKLMSHKFSFEEIVNYFKDKPLEFEPGTKWAYSNSGYVLLGLIIEKVSHMSYESFLKKKIFDPANLNETLADNPKNLIANRAQGYGVKEFSLLSNDDVYNAAYIDLSSAQAAGNLLSTVTDLLKWDYALYGSSILSEYSKSEMFKDQTGTAYGYGWGIDYAFGHKRVRHGGAIHGFLSEFARYIDVNSTIIVWNNTITAEPNREMADVIGAVFLAVIAILPELLESNLGLSGRGGRMLMGGTGLLIVVGVSLDIMQKVGAFFLAHQYRGLGGIAGDGADARKSGKRF